MSSAHEVAEALRAIYPHDLTDEDFSRIHKGKLAEVLNFVAQSVRGRTGTAAARNIIQEFVWNEDSVLDISHTCWVQES